MGLAYQMGQSFFLNMGLGLIPWTFFVSPQKTGRGFFQIVYVIGLAFIVLSAMGENAYSLSLLFPFFALCILGLTLKEEKLSQCSRFFSLIWGAGVIGLFVFTGDRQATLFSLSSLCLLGSTVFAMLLGHWYLVVPKMSEQPLLNVLKVFWVACFFKLLFIFWQFPPLVEFFKKSQSVFDVSIVFLRYLWGPVGLCVLGFFTWKLTKMRSLQSATGILYVMVLFAIIGEFFALYLFGKGLIL